MLRFVFGADTTRGGELREVVLGRSWWTTVCLAVGHSQKRLAMDSTLAAAVSVKLSVAKFPQLQAAGWPTLCLCGFAANSASARCASVGKATAGLGFGRLSHRRCRHWTECRAVFADTRPAQVARRAKGLRAPRIWRDGLAELYQPSALHDFVSNHGVLNLAKRTNSS